MHWQDIVFSIGSWIFLVALVPSLFSKEKPPVFTSILTGMVLLVFAITYYTLGLWMSLASTGILSIAWLALGVQKTNRKY